MYTTDFLFIIAIIPVILILYYIYSKDKNKEPRKLLTKLFTSGIASCFLVLIISFLIGELFPIFQLEIEELNKIELIIKVFIGIALVEEFSKWIMVYLIGYKNKEFDEFYDGIVYAIFVSLGFACIENIIYVVSYNSVDIGIKRGMLAVPGHACYGLFMGYYISKAKLYAKEGNKTKENQYKVLSILIPTLLHGIYDYCVMAQNAFFTLCFLLFVIVLFVYSVIKIKQTSKDLTRLVDEQQEENKAFYCSNCGTKLEGPYCSHCGRKQD